MRSLEYFDLNAHLWICFFLPFIRKESGTATMKCSSSAYEENPAEYELSPIFIFIICISFFFSPHQDFCRWDCISDVSTNAHNPRLPPVLSFWCPVACRLSTRFPSTLSGAASLWQPFTLLTKLLSSKTLFPSRYFHKMCGNCSSTPTFYTQLKWWVPLMKEKPAVVTAITWIWQKE